MTEESNKKWIPELEIENATIKWGFSHFDGNDKFSNGVPNFTVILPEDEALRLQEEGWAIKKLDGFEEGDPPEYTLKCIISYKFDAPKVYLIKGDRKLRVEHQRDLADITRQTCEQLDVILTPSRWVNPEGTGITAYVKELYAKVRESRFSAKYADYQDVDAMRDQSMSDV